MSAGQDMCEFAGESGARFRGDESETERAEPRGLKGIAAPGGYSVHRDGRRAIPFAPRHASIVRACRVTGEPADAVLSGVQSETPLMVAVTENGGSRVGRRVADRGTGRSPIPRGGPPAAGRASARRPDVRRGVCFGGADCPKTGRGDLPPRSVRGDEARAV